MHRQRNRRVRWSALLVATLAGGTVFGTCQIRVHDSVINGTKAFIFGLLDPSNLTIDFGDTTNTDPDATN